MNIQFLIFIFISAITLVSALAVAWSKNIVHSAFALLGVFAGVLGLYVLLSADFVAVVQLVIYIGGILVLILFAVMLTTKIADIKVTNRAMAPFLALIFVGALGFFIAKAYSAANWFSNAVTGYAPTTRLVGEKLLGECLLPFEVVSLLLVLVMIGAVVIARQK